MRRFVFALAGLLASTVAANATLITTNNTYTVTDANSSTVTNALSNPFSLTLNNVSNSSTDILANVTELTDTAGRAVTISIVVDGTTFTFSGTDVFSTPGNSAHDAITWASNAITQTLANGASLQVELLNVSYNGSFPNYDGLNIPVTFTLESQPTPVPEPASIALLGAGIAAFAGFGFVRGRKVEL